MFERFTYHARRVVTLAQEEARMLDHNYIGTEHLLLGIIHDQDCVAAMALAQFADGRDLQTLAREAVIELVGRGNHPPSGHIPFTPRAKKVLELSLREALQQGHNYIGTEHLLLGLIRIGGGVGVDPIRDGGGIGIQVINTLGVDPTQLRQQVLRLIGEGENERDQVPGLPPKTLVAEPESENDDETLIPVTFLMEAPKLREMLAWLGGIGATDEATTGVLVGAIERALGS